MNPSGGFASPTTWSSRNTWSDLLNLGSRESWISDLTNLGSRTPFVSHEGEVEGACLLDLVDLGAGGPVALEGDVGRRRSGSG